MPHRTTLAPPLGLLLLAGPAWIGCVDRPRNAPEEDLRRRLEAVRNEFGLPAVAGAYVSAEGDIVAAVTGVRRIDADDPTVATDLFHLGSVTKPFTGTLAGVLVRDGVVSFDDTVGEALGDLVSGMDAAHRGTTLEQLLRHRAGLQSFEEDEAWDDVPRFDGGAVEKRRAFVEWLLSRPPQTTPGESHRYSNAGYTVAAVMMEEACGESWEDLMASRVLAPLGVEHYGFGWPVETDRPGTWGHRELGGALRPHDPADDGYRLEDQYIGPAGDLSLSIADLARFARLHLLGLRGEEGPLLSAAAIAELHRSLEDDAYAIGWNVRPDRSTHLGSAGTAFAAIYLMRERELGLVVATNAWTENEEEYAAALLRAVLDAAKAA